MGGSVLSRFSTTWRALTQATARTIRGTGPRSAPVSAVDLIPAPCNPATCHTLGAATARRRTYGLSFSWRRALGVSAAKGRLSRAIGVPLTRSGRQRKLGRLTERTFGPILGLGFLAAIGGSLGHCGTSQSTKLEQVQPPRQLPQTQTLPTQAAALTNDELKELQMLLNTLGFNAGPADGISGPQTQSAIGRYDAARSLPQRGTPDRQLLDRLRKEGSTLPRQ